MQNGEEPSLAPLVHCGVRFPDFDHCALTHLVVLAYVVNTEEISFGNTRLSGTIPNELWLASENLNLLSMPNSEIQGTLSSDIGLATNLQILNFVNTNLHGTIPSEIGLLSNSLEWLQLASTNISGTIPSELGLVTGLST